MRFRDPKTPVGDKIEVFIRPETITKMKKLLSIVGGKIIFEKKERDYVHLIIEKSDTSSP